MKIYHLATGWNAPFSGTVHARHRWSLPGVHCEVCDARWTSVGVEYPSVALSGLPDHERFLQPRNVPWAAFAELRQTLRPFVGPEISLQPGTALGPLHGWVEGRDATVGSFVGMVPWTITMRGDSVNALRDAGLRGIVPVDIVLERPSPVTVAELEARPHVSVMNDAVRNAPVCTNCGRRAVSAPPPSELIVARSTIPDLDIFRALELPTFVFVTERFVETCRRAALSNLCVTEVTVT